METSLSVATVRMMTTKFRLLRAGVKNETCPRDGGSILIVQAGKMENIFLRDGRPVITLRDGKL